RNQDAWDENQDVMDRNQAARMTTRMRELRSGSAGPPPGATAASTTRYRFGRITDKLEAFAPAVRPPMRLPRRYDVPEKSAGVPTPAGPTENPRLSHFPMSAIPMNGDRCRNESIPRGPPLLPGRLPLPS